VEQPPYRRIADDIRRRIGTGALRPGDRVPSARQITREWGVAVATATKALAELRADGLTVAEPGRGTVVAAPAGARRGTRQAPDVHEKELSRRRIVRAAITLADADGVAELSMRRIAGHLGVATMSLYRHVDNRDALVNLMIDEVMGEEPLPDPPPPGWRARLETMARAQWTLFRRHPWLAGTMALLRPNIVPRAMAHSEWALAAFEDTRVPLEQRMYVSILLFAYVRGLAQDLEAEQAARRDTGLTAEEWMETNDEALAAILAGNALPMMRRLTADGFDFDLDRMFTLGLDLFLDGVATRIGPRAR
jgi:DNA-binding transcriptional regulator YhcF (GntR family)